MEPADRDAIIAHLRHRTDLIRYIPDGAYSYGAYDVPYWSGVVARFERGEWADAVTAIERRFERRKHKAGDAAVMRRKRKTA
jgi:hypothetical protein